MGNPLDGGHRVAVQTGQSVSQERMGTQTDGHTDNISDKPPSEDVHDQSHLKVHHMLSVSPSGDNPEIFERQLPTSGQCTHRAIQISLWLQQVAEHLESSSAKRKNSLRIVTEEFPIKLAPR